MLHFTYGLICRQIELITADHCSILSNGKCIPIVAADSNDSLNNTCNLKKLKNGEYDYENEKNSWCFYDSNHDSNICDVSICGISIGNNIRRKQRAFEYVGKSGGWDFRGKRKHISC